ncbi:MAG: peptidylprolyl isomerase [Balneolales bacterium]|nr:peptidylprolyl isomerase [Balneolales bacterium]
MQTESLSKNAIILSLILLLSGCSFFYSGKKDYNKTVVGNVNGNDITFKELRASFYASPLLEDESDEVVKQEMMDFLDLYLIYVAKTIDARENGYFDDEEILSELQSYQMQSVFPYWLEMRFREELLDELVDRSKKEVGTMHILVSTREDATPADTTRAYETLLEARHEFLSAGEEGDFLALSEKYSSRQRGQSMGGDLGFISAGWAVKPFEDVAYSLQPGEVSMPFRTSFGYHLVYVYDVRDKQPDRNYSHIFFQSRGPNVSVEAAMVRADSAFAQLSEGANWADVVNTFTEDGDTRANAGDIGWIQPARYQPIFIENISKIEEPGEFTNPFESEYGVHIVRLDSVRTFESEQHLRDELYTLLRNLPRYRENRTFTLQNVRKAGNESWHQDTFDQFIAVHTENHATSVGELPFSEEQLNKPIYTIDGRDFDLSDFKAFVSERASGTPARFSYNMIEQYKNSRAEKVIVNITKREFPDFADLSERYHEGLAVFKLTEHQVWNYAAQDTSRLRQIFEADRDRYRFGTRYRYFRLSADSDSTLNAAADKINSGVPVEEIREHISGIILRTDTINNLIDFPFDHLEGLQENEFTSVFEFRNRPTKLYLAEILEPRQMTFDEAFNRVVADFQPIRDQEWNDELRAQYQIVAFPERLEQILNNIEL